MQMTPADRENTHMKNIGTGSVLVVDDDPTAFVLIV